MICQVLQIHLQRSWKTRIWPAETQNGLVHHQSSNSKHHQNVRASLPIFQWFLSTEMHFLTSHLQQNIHLQTDNVKVYQHWTIDRREAQIIDTEGGTHRKKWKELVKEDTKHNLERISPWIDADCLLHLSDICTLFLANTV